MSDHFGILRIKGLISTKSNLKVLTQIHPKFSKSSYFQQQFLSSRSTHGYCYYFGFILSIYDIKNITKCFLIASAEDGMSLRFFQQKTMAASGHNGSSLTFGFKVLFQNNSILINKPNLINKMNNQLGQ